MEFAILGFSITASTVLEFRINLFSSQIQLDRRILCGCMVFILQQLPPILGGGRGGEKERERESENSVTVTHNFLAKNCDTFLMLDNYVCKIKNLCM